MADGREQVHSALLTVVWLVRVCQLGGGRWYGCRAGAGAASLSHKGLPGKSGMPAGLWDRSRPLASTPLLLLALA